MGNSLGCSASGERLVSAARDGDLIEARMLLEFNPGLAKYSTFGGLNSPLHFAAAKSHNEMVMLLLENGADVNSRNYCGQTALMQACRHGHWEIVQTLLLYRCNVTRADYLSGRTSLHFAAVGGHVRCVRLLVADFVPSSINYMNHVEVVEDKDGCRRSTGLDSSLGRSYDQLSLTKFINKIADGGLTALHMAALNGSFDCVHLLLDLHADVSSVTFPYGSSMNLIGAGSTPLHYAACGGNLKCCQVLLSRGSSRLTLNCNGWLPVDVAKIWGHHALEALLKPNSVVNVPTFLPSNFLSLPLMSILNIAREWGLQSLAICDDAELCPVCLERSCSVVAEGCSHELCVKCALYLCSSNSRMPETEDPHGSVPCPLCRRGIVSFSRLPCNPIKDHKPTPSLSSCNPCILHPRAPDPSSSPPISEFAENHTMPSELICPLTCSPFPSVSVPTCNCKDGPCPPLDESPRRSQSSASQWDKFDDHRLGRTNCSRFCWSRRSCHREHQCNAEINA